MGPIFPREAVFRRVGGVDSVSSFTFRKFDSVRSFKNRAGDWSGEFGSFIKTASGWYFREESGRAKHRKRKYFFGPLEKTRFFE
jgi:hypothetical protein